MAACVPAGVGPGRAILAGGPQDISKSFAPTSRFFDNDGLYVQIMVELPAPIPEPTASVLLGSALGGLLLRGVRRRPPAAPARRRAASGWLRA